MNHNCKRRGTGCSPDRAYSFVRTLSDGALIFLGRTEKLQSLRLRIPTTINHPAKPPTVACAWAKCLLKLATKLPPLAWPDEIANSSKCPSKQTAVTEKYKRFLNIALCPLLTTFHRRWKLRLVLLVVEVEGDLLPGCGWTLLTASLTASQAYRPQNLSHSTHSEQALRAWEPHVIQNILMSMLNTRGHVLLEGFCMLPSLLPLALIGHRGSNRETVWSWEPLSWLDSKMSPRVSNPALINSVPSSLWQKWLSCVRVCVCVCVE